ncbi:MAG: dihydrofolate reductase [Bacteroidota bacterium]
MKLILIAALNKRRVIGRNGAIPWHLPEDLQRFKLLTSHHAVLMGRKTFESIGKILPERRNVVLSHTMSLPDSVEQYSSLEEALQHLSNEEQVFIIGGEEVFRQTVDRVDELLLTIVENEEEGDAVFPPYEHLIGRQFHFHSAEQRQGFRFERYVRLDGTPAIQ